MKRINILFSIIAITSFFLIGCGNKDADINFSTTKIKKEVPYDNKSASPSCSVDLSIDYASGNGKTDDSINETINRTLFEVENLSPKQAIDSFINSYVSVYRNEMSMFYLPNKSQLSSNDFLYKCTVKTSHHNGRKHVLCYEIQKTTFSGGEHELHTVKYINFDKRNGQQVTLAGILTPNSQQKLNEMLLDELLSHFHCTAKNELSKYNVLMNSELYIPDNYLIDEDGVEFLYNEYEIAPYEAGTIKLKIPYKKLKPILKKITDD